MTHSYDQLPGTSWYVLPSEASLAKIAWLGGFAGAGLSADTRDWLMAQSWVNMLLARASNGVADTPQRPSEYLYRYVFPATRWWRGRLRPVTLRGAKAPRPRGKFTKRIWRHLDQERVSVAALYRILRDAEGYLLDPPAELSRRAETRTAGRSSEAITSRIQQTLERRLRRLDGSASVYLHGSAATGDTTNFSDVDDLVVVHRDAWRSRSSLRSTIAKLERAARYLQVLDPLQHHGHWVYSDLDLQCLDEVIPLLVIDDGITLVGEHSLHAMVREDESALAEITWNMVQQLRHDILADAQRLATAYRLKAFISTISLLPALAHQLDGNRVDKKAAIERRTKVFSSSASAAIEWATRARESWPPSGGTAGQIVATMNHVIPARRNVLERLGQKVSASAAMSAIPLPIPWDQILQLTDETIGILGSAVAVQKAP